MGRTIKSEIVRIDKDFAEYMKKVAKKNNMSVTEISRDMFGSFQIMSGKKVRKRILQEVEF